MIITRIYALAIGVLICNMHRLQALDINISINLDLFDKQTKIMVHNQTALIGNCTSFRNESSSVYLLVDKNLRSHKCEAGSVIFYVFAYWTNITSALINVKREGQTLDFMKTELQSISNMIIILSLETNYVSFVVCKTPFPECNLTSVDQQKTIVIPHLILYSACNGTNLPCLTTVDFLSNISREGNIVFSKIDLKPSNMASQYGEPVKCRNGGTVSKGNSSQISLCDCPKNSSSRKWGPQCEILQQKLVDPQYLYVLPNSNFLTIEFLLLASSIQGKVELLKIYYKNGSFMQYNITENQHTIRILNSSFSFQKSLDTGNEWLSVKINITSDNLYIQINELQMETTNKIKAFPLLFDTVPLIIAYSIEDKRSQICLSNLKVNGQMIDLYTPSFSDCQLNCKDCKENETCISVPFKSLGNAICICSLGLGKLPGNDFCSQNQDYQGQIDNNNLNPMLKIQNSMFSSIQFKFRTLSDYGNLVSLTLSKPQNSSLVIGINNRSLSVSLSNLTTTLTKIINGYDISNGQWHGVIIRINSYMLEFIVDDRISFNSEILYFNTLFTLEPLSYMEASAYQLGPMNTSRSSKFNLTTCYDTISLVNTNSQTNPNAIIVLNNTYKGGCSEEPNCLSIQCNAADNRVCSYKWQDSSCVCITKFADVNGTCLYLKCIPNPCQYNGVCVFVSSQDNYECKCASGYSGSNCENGIAAAGFPWWIILIIVLLLLIILILLLIFCVCCKKKRKDKVPDINKIHENTVVYNDHAGEEDYNGPPINFSMIKIDFNFKMPLSKSPAYPTADLQKRKLSIDNDNHDLPLDQALDYGYEGSFGDQNSLSSLGSGSTNEPLDIETLQRCDDNFNYLKNLYQ